MHMHSLSAARKGVCSATHSPSLALSHSRAFSKISVLHQVALFAFVEPLWHFEERAATLTLRNALTLRYAPSHCSTLSHFPTLTSFAFQAAWPQNQFSNNSSHDFIQLDSSFQCGLAQGLLLPHDTLLSLLSLAFHSVVVFIPSRGYSCLLRSATSFRSMAAHICVEYEKRQSELGD